MIIEPEISRCGRDAGGMDLRGAVFSSANTDSGCAHKRHCESNRGCNQMIDGHDFISTLRERGDFGATLSALTVNLLTVGFGNQTFRDSRHTRGCLRRLREHPESLAIISLMRMAGDQSPPRRIAPNRNFVFETEFATRAKLPTPATYGQQSYIVEKGNGRAGVTTRPSESKEQRCPIRSETRATLIASIAQGHRWVNELVANATGNVESIAKREKCSVRQVNMTISLAFLAPDLVKAAIEGRLPRGIGVTRLRDAPVEWSRQIAMLGLIG
jgi:hypothetical protein